MSEVAMRVIKPDPRVFRSYVEKKEERYTQPGGRVFITEKAEAIEGEGQKVYRKGYLHPIRGFPFPEACWQNDLMKMYISGFLKILSHWVFYPSFLLFSVLPKKYKTKAMERLLGALVRGTSFIIEPYVLKDQFWTPAAGEVKYWIFLFCKNYGLNEKLSYDLSDIFCYFIEYDDAYRYRVQDIFSLTTKMAIIENPRKELLRIFQLGYERESNDELNLNTGKIRENSVKIKFKRIISMLSIILLVPSIKKAIIKSLIDIDFHRLQYDIADRYQVMIFGEGYKFLGTDHVGRIEMLKKEFKAEPPELFQIA